MAHMMYPPAECECSVCKRPPPLATKLKMRLKGTQIANMEVSGYHGPTYVYDWIKHMATMAGVSLSHIEYKIGTAAWATYRTPENRI